MSGPRKGRKQVARLAGALSERDHAIIRNVGELRLASARQIERLHFPVPESHASAISAARTARRTLERLVRHRLLVRLERRIGGVRAGSASFVYAIGVVGERIAGLPGPRRRFREPSALFVAHTLAVAELYARLHETERAGQFQLSAIEAEPRCWRQFSGLGGKTMVKPDLFIALASGGFDYRWFVEIDLGSEHLPAVLRKCQAYEAYYRTGVEQTRNHVFPRVLWAVPDEVRLVHIRRAISRASGLTKELFVTVTIDRVLSALAGGQV